MTELRTDVRSDTENALAQAPSIVTARRSVTRFGWGLADQAVSSLSNFGVGIFVARSVSPHQFGVFALAFSLYTVVLGVCRALATDPLVVRHSGAPAVALRAAARSATGTAVVVAGVFAVVIAVAGACCGAQTRPLLLVLALVLPGLMLQDAWRNVFFAMGRGPQAFLNDLAWTVLLAPAFAVVHLVGRGTPATLTLAWGLAAGAAAILGFVQARLVPRIGDTRRWLRGNRRYWPRYLAESLLLTGAQQAYFFSIAAIGGFVAVGRIKLVQLALGPVNIVIQGVGLVAVPEAARALRSGLRRVDRVVAAVSATISFGALCWGLVLAFAPSTWTAAVAGESWHAAAPLLLPLSLLQILNGANTGAFVGLRAFQAPRRSLRIRCLASASFFCGATVGAVIAGATGAAYGLAAASAVNLAAWWRGYHLERGARAAAPVATCGDLPNTAPLQPEVRTR